MPGPITHLQAAYRYNVSHDNTYNEGLYLGSICPDSVNINGQAPKSVRWPAHLRCENLEEWIENTRHFYASYKGMVDNSYLRGYILHILTDIVWDKYFNIPLYKLLFSVGVPQEDLKKERWNEIYGYENTQLNEDWLKIEVIPKLIKAKPLQIGTLSAENISLWQEKVLTFDFIEEKLPKFVNSILMDDLFCRVVMLADNIFE